MGQGLTDAEKFLRRARPDALTYKCNGSTHRIIRKTYNVATPLTGPPCRSTRETTWPSCRAVCVALVALLCSDHSAAAAEPGAAANAGEAADPVRPVRFDIPAQPLASALEAYGIVAGREIIYDGRLAIGRSSASLKGVFTPDAALQALIMGTGLAPRYVASDALILVPSPVDPQLASPSPPKMVSGYYGQIQAGLKQALCANSRTQPGDYRVAMSFWIGPSGMVSRVELLGSTGDADRDAMIDSGVRGLALGVPPPHGFAQPVTMIIASPSPGARQDCLGSAPRQRLAGP